jgi:DNA repair exonuclease SbcCD ATPase subunit
MFTNNEEVVVVKQKIEDLRKMLEALGANKESLVSDIKALEDKALYYNGINEKIDVAEKELVSLDLQKKELETVVALVSENKKSIIEQGEIISELSAGKEKLLESISSLEDKNFQLTSSVDKKEVELEKISNEFNVIKEKNEGVVAGLNANIKILEQEQNNLEKIIRDKNEELLKQRKQFESEIDLLVGEKNDLDIAVKDLKSEKESIELNCLAIKRHADEYADDKMLEADKYYNSKQEEIVNISGDLSNKEAILLKKENDLRAVKKELEEFYNRKIDHIKI